MDVTELLLQDLCCFGKMNNLEQLWCLEVGVVPVTILCQKNGDVSLSVLKEAITKKKKKFKLNFYDNGKNFNSSKCYVQNNKVTKQSFPF